MIQRWLKLGTLIVIGLLGSCGGGSGNVGTAVCTGSCTPPATLSDFLTVDDVQRVIAQAVNEATARKQPANFEKEHVPDAVPLGTTAAANIR